MKALACYFNFSVCVWMFVVDEIKTAVCATVIADKVYGVTFHCDVEFEDVVFDASELSLPSGFDPSKDAIGIDFGSQVNITETDGMYLHMGGKWSQTMSMVEGKPVFTKLIPTPEPTTSTLGLLALAALAARRHRK